MVTVIHLFDNIIFSFILEQKITILGGIFLGLAVYSYFYRKLINRSKNLTKSTKEINKIMIKINEVEEKKSEVQLILDTVAGFSKEIRGFEKGVVDTMRNEMKDLRFELKEYFTKEINRTNEDVQELKGSVEDIKKEFNTEKLIVDRLKSKIGLIVGVAVSISTIILGIIQHFVLKALG